LAKELSTNPQSSLLSTTQSLHNQTNHGDILKPSFNSCPLVLHAGNYNFSLGDSFEGLENMDLKSVSSLTDSSLIQIQKQMMQLREDNCKLISVLQANNQVMKKNLKIAQGLKDELDLAKKSYEQLKESSEETISKLKAENVQLKEKVNQLEAEESIKYGKLSLNQELDLQNQCAKVIEKEQKIEALTKELENLKVECDNNSDNELAAALKDQCETYFKKYKIEENLKTKLMKENQALKELIKQLREEKFCLEEQLDKGEPLIDLKPSNNQETNEENTKSRRGGSRHRHAHKLKMLQIPVLNPGIILQGFKQHRT
jgi:myosin type-2 heavy chain 1